MICNLKNVIVTISIVGLSVIQYGCGEGSETNAPAVPLTASKVVSSTVSTHNHTVSIPFTDVSSSPADVVIQYRSDITNGHSHVIALSRQQMIDLNNGMQLTLISSDSSPGTGHTHSWNLQGGSVLYEKNCYNCHSNDKRNHTPMNVAFNASQISAVQSPGSAPVSSAAAVTPDPNYTPPTTIIPDGVALYGALCESCHGLLATSAKLNRTAQNISDAIIAVPRMNSLSSLTPAQIQAIATALVK